MEWDNGEMSFIPLFTAEDEDEEEENDVEEEKDDIEDEILYESDDLG